MDFGTRRPSKIPIGKVKQVLSRGVFFTCVINLFHVFCVYGQNSDDIKSHRIYSPFQKDSTTIQVLLPDDFSQNENHRVLYILPVREQGNKKSGDPLVEIIKHDLHNRHRLICVFPGYTHLPWYADHSVDKTKQDESHFLKTVLPFVEKNYPTIREKEGRLLMGFSKSGWGALTLLLRNTETFYKAAGWDVGIRMDVNVPSDSAYVRAADHTFGDLGNFEKYRVSTLLKNNKDKLGTTSRIFYYNTGGNRARGGALIHNLMVELEIPHLYIFEPKRKHRWDSGWIPEAVNFLVKD
ncbi:MAG: alpha/beta hydrolase-fold protein [Cyclobacteriaceae bacterium]